MFAHTRSAATRCAAAILAATSFAAEAGAHINLVSPLARELGSSRDPNSNVKRGPCGQEANGRTSKVSVFEPGQTLDVTWEETTNHRSYYRVAFDVDGDDAFPTFAGTGRGAQGIDPSGPCPVDGQVILAYDMDDRSGGTHTLSVRLPDVECESCTLQVVQFMYDTARPYYFQCADIALRRAPALAAAAPDAGARDAGLPGTPSDAAAAATPSGSSAAPGCSIQIGPSESPPAASPGDEEEHDAPSAAAPASPAATAGSPSTVEPGPRRAGGCSLIPARRRTSSAFALLIIGVWALSRARRRIQSRPQRELIRR